MRLPSLWTPVVTVRGACGRLKWCQLSSASVIGQPDIPVVRTFVPLLTRHMLSPNAAHCSLTEVFFYPVGLILAAWVASIILAATNGFSCTWLAASIYFENDEVAMAFGY